MTVSVAYRAACPGCGVEADWESVIVAKRCSLMRIEVNVVKARVRCSCPLPEPPEQDEL